MSTESEGSRVQNRGAGGRFAQGFQDLPAAADESSGQEEEPQSELTEAQVAQAEMAKLRAEMKIMQETMQMMQRLQNVTATTAQPVAPILEVTGQKPCLDFFDKYKVYKVHGGRQSMRQCLAPRIVRLLSQGKTDQEFDALTDEGVSELLRQSFKPIDKFDTIDRLEKMEPMRDDLKVKSLQDYLMRFTQIVELAGKEATPEKKALKRAFVHGVRPEVVKKRVKQHGPESYQEAFTIVEAELREVERMVVALGVYGLRVSPKEPKSGDVNPPSKRIREDAGAGATDAGRGRSGSRGRGAGNRGTSRGGSTGRATNTSGADQKDKRPICFRCGRKGHFTRKCETDEKSITAEMRSEAKKAKQAHMDSKEEERKDGKHGGMIAKQNVPRLAENFACQHNKQQQRKKIQLPGRDEEPKGMMQLVAANGEVLDVMTFRDTGAPHDIVSPVVAKWMKENGCESVENECGLVTPAGRMKVENEGLACTLKWFRDPEGVSNQPLIQSVTTDLQFMVAETGHEVLLGNRTLQSTGILMDSCTGVLRDPEVKASVMQIRSFLRKGFNTGEAAADAGDKDQGDRMLIVDDDDQDEPLRVSLEPQDENWVFRGAGGSDGIDC